MASREGSQPPTPQMLEALQPILKPGSVVAITSDKTQKVVAKASSAQNASKSANDALKS
jgi:hypothetical protein